MNKKMIIGITGAGGALGKSLTKKFKSEGYKIIGFSHSQFSNSLGDSEPDEWVKWECGKEYLLENDLKKIDILILNHFLINVLFHTPILPTHQVLNPPKS